MAEETVEIIRIKFDADDAIKEAALLRDSITKLQEENKKLDKTTEAGRLQLEKNNATIRLYKKELSDQQRFIDNTVKANQAAQGSNEQLRATLSNLTQQYNALSKEERNNSDAGKTLQAQLAAISAELKTNEGAIGDFRRNVGDYEGAVTRAANSISGLKDRLKELQATIQSSPIDSQQFRDAQDEAGKLGLQIGQLEGKLDEFGNREPKNPAKKAFEDGLAAAGAFASGVTLLGEAFSENEDVNQAVAGSLKSIAVAQNIANIVKEKGAIIDTLSLARTQALTAATGLFATITGTATGALKVFRLALAGVGIGLLVAAIGLLVENFDKLKNAVLSFIQPFTDFLGLTSEQERAAEQVTAEYNRQIEAVQNLQRAEQIRFDVVLKGLDRQIKLAKSLGKDTNELEKQRAATQQRSLQSAIDAANQEIALLIKRGIQTEAQATKYAELQKVLRETRQEILDTVTDEQVRINERNRALDEELKKRRELARGRVGTIESREITTIDTTGREKQLRDQQAKELQIQFETNQKKIEQDQAYNQRKTELALEFTRQYGIEEEALYEEFNARREELLGIGFDAFLRVKEQEIQAQQQANERLLGIALDFATQAGDLFADSLNASGEQQEEFQRRFILLLLDTLQKQIQLAVAGAIAREIGTKGLPGILTGAVAAAAIQTAFGIAKSKIAGPSKFADGVVDLSGPGNGTSDSIPAYLSRGESVITERGTKFAQAYYPGFLEFLNTKNKFADGVVGINQQAIPAAQVDIGQQIRSALAGLQIVTRVTDIEKAASARREVRSVGVI
jgi:hypothetical protein